MYGLPMYLKHNSEIISSIVPVSGEKIQCLKLCSTDKLINISNQNSVLPSNGAPAT